MVNEWHVAVAKPASRPEWRDAARAPSFNYHYEYDDEVEGDSFRETGDDGTRGTTYPYDVADISPGGGGGGGSHGHGSNGASKPDATFPSAASLGVATSPAPPRGVAASAAPPGGGLGRRVTFASPQRSPGPPKPRHGGAPSAKVGGVLRHRGSEGGVSVPLSTYGPGPHDAAYPAGAEAAAAPSSTPPHARTAGGAGGVCCSASPTSSVAPRERSMPTPEFRCVLPLSAPRTRSQAASRHGRGRREGFGRGTAAAAGEQAAADAWTVAQPHFGEAEVDLDAEAVAASAVVAAAGMPSHDAGDAPAEMGARGEGSADAAAGIGAATDTSSSPAAMPSALDPHAAFALLRSPERSEWATAVYSRTLACDYGTAAPALPPIRAGLPSGQGSSTAAADAHAAAASGCAASAPPTAAAPAATPSPAPSPGLSPAARPAPFTTGAHAATPGGGASPEAKARRAADEAARGRARRRRRRSRQRWRWSSASVRPPHRRRPPPRRPFRRPLARQPHRHVGRGLGGAAPRGGH